ncbi:hypothetical protein BB559_000899 [Furculomyces boomerangus]|uniref:GATA-type domain-containing protein n=1 Tax=Furculomyces boomerangus TaxID=61424 RepID=A0A2T9Z3P7_9FUNG|nr:hypothetical protein BB559_000899 [Furculomyces boomerangus]
MASIILKIKGPKIFSSVRDFHGPNDLSEIWKVCSKVKDSLENGLRLENLSWRLWHLQNSLDFQEENPNFQHFTSRTQTQNSDNKNTFTGSKSLKIKVKLGKNTDPQLDIHKVTSFLPENSIAILPLNSHKNQFQHDSNTEKSKHIKRNSLQTGSKHHKSHITHISPFGDNVSHIDNIDNSSGNHNSNQNSPQYTHKDNFNTATSNIDAKSQYPYKQEQTLETFQPTKQSEDSPRPDSLEKKDHAIQASELMSFGPSSFLSSCASLDPPQIEITMDDIFPVETVGDWGHYGFSNYNNLSKSPNGRHPPAVSNAWDTIANPSSVSNQSKPQVDDKPTKQTNPESISENSEITDCCNHPKDTLSPCSSSNCTKNNPVFPQQPSEKLVVPEKFEQIDNFSSTNSGNESDQGSFSSSITNESSFQSIAITQQFPTKIELVPLAGRSDGPECQNCKTRKTPLWRRCEPNMLLCNACGLYYRVHNKHRTKTFKPLSNRKDSSETENFNQLTECTNCQTSRTPLWRRDEQGNVLCNACGLYYKLHGEKRPITLKSDVIRKRLRSESSAPGHKNKGSEKVSSKKFNRFIQPNTFSFSSIKFGNKDLPHDGVPNHTFSTSPQQNPDTHKFQTEKSTIYKPITPELVLHESAKSLDNEPFYPQTESIKRPYSTEQNNISNTQPLTVVGNYQNQRRGYSRIDSLLHNKNDMSFTESLDTRDAYSYFGGKPNVYDMGLNRNKENEPSFKNQGLEQQRNGGLTEYENQHFERSLNVFKENNVGVQNSKPLSSQKQVGGAISLPSFSAISNKSLWTYENQRLGNKNGLVFGNTTKGNSNHQNFLIENDFNQKQIDKKTESKYGIYNTTPSPVFNRFGRLHDLQTKSSKSLD